MAGGVTTTGFVLKTIEEILDEIGQAQLATIDPALDISPDQPLGQINGINAKKLAEAWEALQTAYNAFNRGAAEGALLDAIGLLTGTKRLPATKSSVVVTLDLDAAITVPADSIIAVDGQPAVRFALKTAVTSTGAGTYPGTFEATVTGPISANSGTLTVIVTPVSGWNSATNPLDADLGTVQESDTDYRKRQIQELQAPGECTVDAIRADLLLVAGVIEAFVFENTSMATDGDGVPPKAYECVIWDGSPPDADNTEVGQTIWNSKPAGIETYGSTSVTVKDSQDNDRTVKFSRATGKNVYLTYVLSVDPETYPVDGDAQVRAAVLAKGATSLKMGSDVIALVLKAAPLVVTGVLDVTDFRLGFSSSPSGTTNLTIGSREIARLDTSRIGVTS